jgi:2-C-methyl-D-erythritol 2,4-cyclodiphosphate synthase
MMRVGLGYDIHRTAPGVTLVLGGVEIPCELGLSGHSDADVALHAVMDALLGAAGLGDIGHHFPPTDERFRGISSLELLARVRDLLSVEGYHPVNVDVVVVAEQPRIGPHAAAMRERIGSVLGLQSSAVSIKATTNEGVGPEGRMEAISAQAIALVEKR